MHRLSYAVMLLIVTTALPAPGAARPKHLFILAGEATMARANTDASFNPIVEAKYGKKNVTVIRDAQAESSIRRWYRDWQDVEGEIPEGNGDLYDRLMGKVGPVVKSQKFTTITFVWVQGESDAESGGKVYADSLRGLLDQLRTELKRPDLNVVIGRLHDFRNDEPHFPEWDMIREAQVKVAGSTPRGDWVDTDDLNGANNDFNYQRKGYRALGQRLATRAIALNAKH